jgi:Fur family ferric uptake transcriptional regulator
MARRLHDQLGRYLDRQGPVYGRPDPPPPQRESEALAQVLDGLGHQNPVEQLLMLEAFLSAGQEEHLSARSFSELLQSQGHDISTEKAASALELFSALGFAEKNYAEDGRVLYESSRPGLHHDHIICGGCGRTVEFERPDVDQLIEKIACDENYCHLSHRLVVRGLCPDCRLRRRAGLPLAETTAGELVLVVGFEGPEEIKQRLAGLGVHRGARMKVLGEQTGSMIVMLDGCRLALGPEMSSGIIVRAIIHRRCQPRILPMAGGPADA